MTGSPATRNRLTENLSRLRTAPEGPVHADLAAAVASHLFFRTKAARDLAGETMLMAQRFKARLATPAAMLAFIGADGPRPGKRFDEFIDLTRADPRWSRTFGGVPLRRARMALFQAVRSDPRRFAGGQMEKAEFGPAFPVENIAPSPGKAHIDALEEDVSVTPTEVRFAGLTRSVMDYDQDLSGARSARGGERP